MDYSIEVRENDVILSKGTPERGETIMLHGFNSSSTFGGASHYCNGNESICGWKIVDGKLKFIYR